jgi:hypothetical protein
LTHFPFTLKTYIIYFNSSSSPSHSLNSHENQLAFLSVDLEIPLFNSQTSWKRDRHVSDPRSDNCNLFC